MSFEHSSFWSVQLNVLSEEPQRLTMRCSERPPAVRSRFPSLVRGRFGPRSLSVAVAHLGLVRGNQVTMMTVPENRSSRWTTLPVSLRAIIIGIVIGLIPANVWPALLLSLRVPVAASVEVVFLGLYVWWASGGGPPHGTSIARGCAFRSATLARAQCFWGVARMLWFSSNNFSERGEKALHL